MRILVDWDLRCVDVWTRNESKHNVSAWHHQNQLQVPQEARIWSSWFRSMLCDKDRNWKNINLEYRMLPVSVLEDRLSLTVMLCFRKAWLCWLSDFVMFEKSLTVMSACYVWEELDCDVCLLCLRKAWLWCLLVMFWKCTLATSWDSL